MKLDDQILAGIFHTIQSVVVVNISSYEMITWLYLYKD